MSEGSAAGTADKEGLPLKSLDSNKKGAYVLFLFCATQNGNPHVLAFAVIVWTPIRAGGAMKYTHEFRDPIHTFISVRTDERNVIDSRPFQRLRHIHQLALTYLVYPGTTHKRFEHSLGVMDLASRIFDVVTAPESLLDNSVREIIPDAQGRSYWKSVLRMAALMSRPGTSSVFARG